MENAQLADDVFDNAAPSEEDLGDDEAVAAEKSNPEKTNPNSPYDSNNPSTLAGGSAIADSVDQIRQTASSRVESNPTKRRSLAKSPKSSTKGARSDAVKRQEAADAGSLSPQAALAPKAETPSTASDPNSASNALQAGDNATSTTANSVTDEPPPQPNRSVGSGLSVPESKAETAAAAVYE